jgi:hypothetical protein
VLFVDQANDGSYKPMGLQEALASSRG